MPPAPNKAKPETSADRAEREIGEELSDHLNRLIRLTLNRAVDDYSYVLILQRDDDPDAFTVVCDTKADRLKDLIDRIKTQWEQFPPVAVPPDHKTGQVH